MLTSVLAHARRVGHHLMHTLRRRLAAATKPTSLILLVDTLTDLSL